MKIKVLSTIGLFVFLALPARSQDHDHGHGQQIEERVKDIFSGLSKKSSTFKGYGALRLGFRSICSGLLSDLRIEKVVEVLKTNSERDPLCGACRPLYRTFQSECAFVIAKSKPKKSAKRTSEPEEQKEAEDADIEPTPEPRIPAPNREPSPIVIDRVSRVFNSIAEDSEISRQSIGAIGKLVFLLQDKNIVPNPAAREYYAILGSYIMAPFDGLTPQNPADADASAAGQGESKEGNLDVLFDE